MMPRTSSRSANRLCEPTCSPAFSAQAFQLANSAVEPVHAYRIVADWCEPAGGTKAFNPAELALLAKAAEMTLVLPRDPGNQVRVLNSVRSVLSQCGLLGRKREPTKPSLAEYLARKNAAPEATP